MYNVQRLVPRLQGVSVGRSLLARPRPLMATQTTSSSLLTAPSREFGTFEEYKKPISYRNGRYEDDVINNGASRRGGSATSSTATPTTQTHSGDKLRVPSEYAQENSTQNSGGILDQASQLAANLTSKAKEVMKDGFNKVGDAMSSARSAMSDNMGLKSDDTNISSSSSSMNSLHNSVKPKSQDTYSAFSSSQKDDRPFPSGVKTTSPERDSEFPSKHKVQSKNQNAKKKTDQGRPVEGLRNMGSSIPINPSDFHTGTGATGGGISSTSSGTSSGMGGSTGMGSLKGTGMGEGSNKSQFTELSSNNPFNISIENQKDMATDAMSSKKPTPLDKQADLSLDKMAGADYANFNHLTGAGGTSSKPAFKPASSSIGLKPSDAITSPPITEIRRPFSMGTQKPTGAEHKKSMAGADYGSMQGPDKSGERAEGMSQASHKRSNKSEDEEMDMSKRVDRSATASAKHMENTGTAGSAIGMGSVSHAPSQGKGPEESAPSVSQGVFSSGPRLDDKDKQDRQEVSWEKKDMKDSNVKQDNEASGRFNKATHMDASKRDSTTGGPKIGATFSPMGEDGLGPRGTRKKSTKAGMASSTTEPSLGLNETNKDKKSNAAMSNMEDTEEHKKPSKRHSKTSTGTGKSKTVGNVSDTNEKQSPTERFLDSVASTRRGNEMKNDGGAPQEQNWEKLNTSGDHSALGHKGGPKSMAREPKQEEMKDNLQNPQRRSMGSVGSVEEMESPNLDAEIHAPSGRSAPASRTADTRAVDGQYGKSRPVNDNSLPTSDEQWKPM